MNRFFVLIVSMFIFNISHAFLEKPSKPVLIADQILVPEKKFQVKAFSVKQLPDVTYAKSNKKIKGAKKQVVLPFYSITFPKKHKLEKEQYEKRKGINIVTNILGISEKTYKHLTNWGYGDLSKQLQSAGFEVIDKQRIIDNDLYRKMKSKSEKIKKGYSQYHPDDLKIAGQFSKSMMTSKLMDAFKSDVIAVNLSLDPMARQRDQSKFVTKRTKVGQAVHVSHLEALIHSINNAKCSRGSCYTKATGSVAFINPIHSDIVFAQVEDDTNAKANVAGHAVTALLRIGGGTAKTNYTFNYVLNADEQKYIEAAKDALSKSNKRLVDELSKLY